jgi:hypothetical protein
MATLFQLLSPMAAAQDKEAVYKALSQSTGTASAVSLKPAGLVIKAGASPLAKIGATDYYAAVGGTLVRIPASTDMPALTGINVGAGRSRYVSFYVNAAGVVTAVAGAEGATSATVGFPTGPAGTALVGSILINASGAFTGGTTALDATTSTVYFDGNSFNPAAA